MRCIILFVILRTTNKRGENGKKELFRRTGKNGPLCQGHGASDSYSHTSIFWPRRNVAFFGDIHEELPIAKATVSQHLKELKEAGLIQGEIEAPKVRYCINKENWKLAKKNVCRFPGSADM